ncbi:MAG TPA: J domain-containing protein [Bacteroidia bacterium]|jgi:hypothetical protein|nr:J domain-containing protein [Bacteroidia bacterium]
MNYFKDCNTIDEVEALYRALAKQHHPDRGGNVAIMQAINNEYPFACANIAKGENLDAQETESKILKAEQYRQPLEKIITLEGIVIELVGSWIWVTGNTYPHRTMLKEAGFMFASKKVAWYFRTDEYKTHSRHQLSLDEIKGKYGSKGISSKNSTKHLY